MNKARLYTAAFLACTSLALAGCSDDEDSASSAGGGSSNGNLGPSEPTGRIAADGFFVLYDPAIPTVFDSEFNYSQQTVVITAFADDVNDLVEVSGQTVNFRAEWGSWVENRDACVLENGQCSVTWRSGDPGTAPGTCGVAITAWTVGEESFFDANDNGLFDAGETFNDLEEPFLNINGSDNFGNADNVYTAGIATTELVGELIDIINFDGNSPGARNGSHDAGNNQYDGSLCATGNAQCSGRESMIIHTRSTLLIQEPFTDSDDLDGDNDTDENINLCSGNPF